MFVDNAVVLRASRSMQGSREAELVAIEIGEVEIALPPLGIAGRGRGLQPRRKRLVVKCIDIGDIENYPSPPGPAFMIRLSNQVEITRSRLKAGERRFFAAVQDGEAQRTVKPDCARHVVRTECDCAD